MKNRRIWVIALILILIGFAAGCSNASGEAGDNGGASEQAGASNEGEVSGDADSHDDSGATDEDSKEAEDARDASSTPGKNDVVTINDKTFDKEDLEFFTLMERIQIEVARHFDKEQYDGKEWEDRNAYWDEQLSYFENINVQLQNLVEIYAMALLAEEKHYFNPEEKLDEEVAKYLKEVENITEAYQLIRDYGEKEFKYELREYMDYSLLRDRVVSDLTDDIKEENPDITDAELNYELAKAYEELFHDQMNDLQIEVHIK